jgi:hypothetical protein
MLCGIEPCAALAFVQVTIGHALVFVKLTQGLVLFALEAHLRTDHA